jgi:hypothetical protein
MKLEVGMICKHFKGTNLIEKNIYKIIAINPKYTGIKEFPNEVYVVYETLFQDNKVFIREYNDLIELLSNEDKIKYNQEYRVQPLSEEELIEITKEDFIKNKKKYIEEKYNK